MEQIINILIERFMDGLEEFVSAVKFPTQAYTRRAFIVSLIFLAGVVALNFVGIGTIVKWDSALTCSIILCIIAFIDATTRSKAKKMVKGFSSKVVEKTSKLKSAVIITKTEEIENSEEDLDNGEQ